MSDIRREGVEDREKRKIPHAQHRPNDLIASDRVEGTAVFRPDGVKIGRIDHFMVEKRSGHVEYVVMDFGELYKEGGQFRPIPWDAIEYRADLDGYVLAVEDDVLEAGPAYEADSEPTWDLEYATRVYS